MKPATTLRSLIGAAKPGKAIEVDGERATVVATSFSSLDYQFDSDQPATATTATYVLNRAAWQSLRSRHKEIKI